MLEESLALLGDFVQLFQFLKYSFSKNRGYAQDKNKKRVIPNIVIGLVLLVGIVWVSAKFVHLGDVEYTNNAQVNQHLTPINTRVQGFIKRICFEEYQPVKKGDTLVIIEDTEYQLKVARRGRLSKCVGRDERHAYDHQYGRK